jgi:hypothetical protein
MLSASLMAAGGGGHDSKKEGEKTPEPKASVMERSIKALNACLLEQAPQEKLKK